MQHISENIVQKFPRRAIVRVADWLFLTCFCLQQVAKNFIWFCIPYFVIFRSLTSFKALWLVSMAFWLTRASGLGCRGHIMDYNKLCHFQSSSSIMQLLSSLAPKDLSRDYGMNPAFSPSFSRLLLLCLSLTKSKNLLLELQTHWPRFTNNTGERRFFSMLNRWLLWIVSAIYMQENWKPVIKMGPTLQQNSCVCTVGGTTGERWGNKETEVSIDGLTYTCRPSSRFFDSIPCFYSLIHKTLSV